MRSIFLSIVLLSMPFNNSCFGTASGDVESKGLAVQVTSHQQGQ